MSFAIPAFATAPSRYRPMPLWTWNGRMTQEQVIVTVQQFKESGLGGFFIHPRPGLKNEYLSAEWFALWGCALEEAKRHGMECNLYDEDTYPSGYGGGHVTDRRPDLAAQYFVAKLVLPGEQFPAPEETLWIEELAHSNSKLFILMRTADCTPWTAWHPPVDMLNPETAKTFLEVTHKDYAQHFGDSFGKEITHAFSDEPSWMMRDVRCREERSLPCTPTLFAEFKSEYGYDLKECIIDLFIPGEQGRVTRYDYFSTVQRIWTQNFLRPIHDWCAEHSINYTGHFMEHEWPLPLNQGSTMDAMRWMQSPGIDLLAFQYDFKNPTRNDWMLLNIKEAASVCRQLGRERVVCESHGAGGHDLRFKDFKALSDFAIVHGVNLINPHMCDQSIIGPRKYDWPQTLSDHSPWWPHYHVYADHTGRVITAVTQGYTANRTLVLHPSTSAWAHFVPEEVDGVFNEKLMTMRHTQCTLIQSLADRQVDFDLGDELLMRDHASVDGTRLRIGEVCYEHIVLPPNMENWCESTLTLMEAYLSNGGKLRAHGEAPTCVNGRPDSRPAALQAKYANNWVDAHDIEQLYALIQADCPPRISQANGEPLPACVHHQFRVLDNGDHLHFITNSNTSERAFSIRVAGCELVELNTYDGSRARYPAEVDDEHVTAEVVLPESGHLLFISSCEKDAEIPDKPTAELVFKPLQGPTDIRRPEPNLLLLDYCTLAFRGETQEQAHVMDADLWIWKQLGFPRNIWDRAVQFKDQYSQYTFDDTTAFSVEYRFMAGASRTTLDSIELAIENPQLYQIFVNGKAADFSQAVSWFDHEIKTAPIGALLQNGENLIRLERSQFHIDCTISQVYLHGDFATSPADVGFAIHNPQTLATGDWVERGLHFYRGGLAYDYEVEVPEDAKSMAVRVADWNGAVIKVRLNGQDAGNIAFPPYELIIDAPAAGTHTLETEVVGSLRNLLGSHYNDGIASRWSWECHPRNAPAGAAYSFVSQGLTCDVEIAFQK